MMAVLEPLNLREMTWREIFATIERNFTVLLNSIVDLACTIDTEQFESGGTVFELSHVINENTHIAVYKNMEYIGGRVSTQYILGEQKLTFYSAVDPEDIITVQYLQTAALTTFSQEYVEEIREIYDQLRALNINIAQMTQDAEAIGIMNQHIADIITPIASGILNAQRYIENLISQIEPMPEGSFEVEVQTARRGELLLGIRLDAMPFKFGSLEEMKRATNLIVNDMVFTKEDEVICIYIIAESYEGSLPTVELNNGLIAIKYLSNKIDDTEYKCRYFEGTESSPVNLKDLGYSIVWFKGYWKHYETDDLHYAAEETYCIQWLTHNLDNATIYHQKILKKEYEITYDVNGNFISMEEMFDEIGNTYIGDIGESITDAIRKFYNRQTLANTAVNNRLGELSQANVDTNNQINLVYQSLTVKISNETVRAQGAENTINQAIVGEVRRATLRENEIQNQLNEIGGRTTIIVDKSGGGDYTSFYEALEYAYNSVENARVYVKVGTYDLLAETKAKLGVDWISNLNHTKIILLLGKGMVIECEPGVVIQFMPDAMENLENVNDFIIPFASGEGSYTIKGGKWISSNTKCVFHDSGVFISVGTMVEHTYENMNIRLFPKNQDSENANTIEGIGQQPIVTRIKNCMVDISTYAHPGRCCAVYGRIPAPLEGYVTPQVSIEDSYLSSDEYKDEGYSLYIEGVGAGGDSVDVKLRGNSFGRTKTNHPVLPWSYEVFEYCNEYRNQNNSSSSGGENDDEPFEVIPD